MQVKNLVKSKDGTYLFDGELSEEEHEFVLNIGLASLLEQGAIPFMTADEETAYKFIPGSDELN